MARKNNVKSDHPGSIHFDSRTRTVMAGQDNHDNIKEKVQSVREVVPGKSNNEIVLVLQYYDYNVEKAIQAYFEDGAKEALGEWHVPAVKPNKKKKNKKKPSSPSEADTGASTPTSTLSATASAAAASSSSPLAQRPTPAASNGNSITSSSSNSSKQLLPNGDVHIDSESRLEIPEGNLLGAAASDNALPSVPSTATVSSKMATENSSSVSRTQNHPRTHSGSHGHGHGHGHGHHNHSHGQRARTASERSTASSVGAGGDNHSKRPFHGLEKSIKDLQRQTTSLERLRHVLDNEMDRSHKSIKTVFAEMRMYLDTRETQLLADMDVVKQQAYDVFKMRQEKAAMLKIQIERAEKLSESELVELRADVKHFVADRKVDEELGKTTRFHYDSDHLQQEIMTFGEVLPVKCAYSVRRPSVSSVASSGVGNEDVSAPAQHSPVATQPASIQDGYQMTTEEVADLQMRLKNSLKIQGFSQGSPGLHSAGTGSSASQEDEARKTKSAKRRNRNRERQEQRKNEEDAASAKAALVSTTVSATDSRPSVHQQSAPQSVPDAGDPHSSPRPQRPHNHSPTSARGMGSRGRGGRRGSGSGGYRGQGHNRGSPRRQYSGSGPGGGGGGGGGRGGGEPDRRQSARPVLVNGSVN